MNPFENIQTKWQALVNAAGGAMAFALSWVLGEFSERFVSWFRRQARRDATLHSFLESLDEPGARDQVRRALELAPLLAEVTALHQAAVGSGGSAVKPALPPEPAGGMEENLTDLALSEKKT